MKRILFIQLAICLAFTTFAQGQVTQNFNSTPGTPLNAIKSFLQDHCWSFPGFDINANGWMPGLEGDGAMVSVTSSTPPAQSGILTPLLELGSTVNLSFSFKPGNSVADGQERWIDILQTDYNNNTVSSLDRINISELARGISYSYAKNLNSNPGCYRLFIKYGGNTSNALAIDQLNIGASYKYTQGCARAPQAVNDQFTGAANRNAGGNVLTNDQSFANGSGLSAYLIKASPDGTVNLSKDGSFVFSPNPGFTGSVTSFTYKVCDNSVCSPLCSEDATVILNFPSRSFLPVSLIDFNGVYKDRGMVEISWTTTFEQNTRAFEIERSLDGNNWIRAGSVDAQGVSATPYKYVYRDDVGRNTALRKDLYYRLKQVDMDGRTALSRILVVRVYNTRALKMISITPNPARNDIAASIQVNESSVAVCKILGTAGNEVMRKTVHLEEGTNRVTIDGSHQLQPGIYVLEVIINSRERMLVKLVKE